MALAGRWKISLTNEPRKDTLHAAFFIGSILLFFNYLRSGKHHILWFSFILFVLALFSKSSSISFFPIVIAGRIYFRNCQTKTISLQEFLYYLLVFISTAGFVYWYSWNLESYGIIRKGWLEDRTVVEWFLNSINYYRFYFEKILWPVALSVTYDFPSPATRLLMPGYFAFSAVFVISLGIVLLFCQTVKRHCYFLWPYDEAWFQKRLYRWYFLR